MITMKLLLESCVGSKSLNRGSGWSRPTSCTPRFVSGKPYLFTNPHALAHLGKAHAGGPRRQRVGHDCHAVDGRRRRGKQVVELGTEWVPANVLHAEICFGKELPAYKSELMTKLAPEAPDTITCAMITMQLLAKGGVGRKLLNRGSGWIRPTSCTPIFVSAQRCLFSNLHPLVHCDKARAGGPQCQRVRHAFHAVAGRGRRGEQVVEQGLRLDPADILHTENSFSEALSVYKPVPPSSS